MGGGGAGSTSGRKLQNKSRCASMVACACFTLGLGVHFGNRSNRNYHSLLAVRKHWSEVSHKKTLLPSYNMNILHCIGPTRQLYAMELMESNRRPISRHNSSESCRKAKPEEMAIFHFRNSLRPTCLASWPTVNSHCDILSSRGQIKSTMESPGPITVSTRGSPWWLTHQQWPVCTR